MSVPFPKSLVSSHYFYTSHAPPGHLGSFLTIFAAPREAGDYLDNLRLEIYESREDLKKANRRQRPRSNSDPKSGGRASFETGSLRVLNDTMKHPQREFVKLEKPFLEEPRDDGDIDSPWIHYTARVNYCDMNLSQHFSWLRTRAEVIDMAQRVDRIQTRKIAHEMQTALM